MTAVGQRAFAVWWKDLPVWSPRAFVGSGWEWPSEYIHPLGSALRRRNEEVKRSGLSLEGLQLITIRFSGDVQPREVSAAGIFKGRLFTAHAGDVVYSKIDVRNGAIGVVPASMPAVAVSSEYPVYQVRPDVADPEYITLLFRTAHFRGIINGMVSGASGRKRVEPERLESIEIPLPPLSAQRAIVERWRAAQADTAATQASAAAVEAEIPQLLLAELGIRSSKEAMNLPRAFALPWRELVLSH